MVITLSPDMLCNDISRSSFPSNTPLVLIADDDDLTRTVLRQVMQDEGYQVAEAQNGQECMEQYATLQPALVLLDGNMPLIDGFTCCAMLHEHYGNATAPILMVTSLDSTISIEHAFAAGVSDYITKPFNWAVLSHRIRRLLQELELKKQCQQVHETVELRVQKRTAQLHTELEYAVALNKIAARVHSLLDEAQILHAATQELALALGINYCTGVLTDTDQQIIYAQNECADLTADPQKLLTYLSQHSETGRQTVQSQLVHFCSVTPDAKRNRMSVLVCPISMGEITFGNLLLISDEAQILTEQEIQLVQQVTNQCAIAIRHARLYQASQSRVQELEQLNQGKDEFLSTVVHELRSPLANMQLATHALGRLLDSGQNEHEAIEIHAANISKSRTCLKILDSECEKELSLVNNLLDLQRLETRQESWGESIPIPLPDWILNIIETFEERIKLQKQTLQLEIAPQMQNFLFTNPNALERVLRELITNACKYSPPEEKIVISIYTDTQMLHLSITNTGVEIPQSELSQIFNRFYRIPNSDRWQQGGSGLGLELVKRLVETINGSIEVESSNGQCCFTVKLPI